MSVHRRFSRSRLVVAGPVGSILCASCGTDQDARTDHQIVVAIDHTKLGTKAQARVLDFDQIDLLVTVLDPWGSAARWSRNVVEIA